MCRNGRRPSGRARVSEKPRNEIIATNVLLLTTLLATCVSNMRRFSQPVVIKDADGHGGSRNVTSVQAAIEHLACWREHGPKWRRAVVICADAMEYKVSPEEARVAFEAAAKEAGALYTERD